MSSAPRARGWAQRVLHPPKYLGASLTVSLGGLLNGLDTGTISPVTTMPYFVSIFGDLDPALRGIVVSCVMLSATVASLFAGALADRLGRPRAIAIGALVNGLGAALEAGAANLPMFIAGRTVLGIGQGLMLSTEYVYICEISPPNKRGVLASLVQVLICLGIMVGYFLCYGTINIESSLSWRLPLAFQAGTSLFLTLMASFYLPHSPRWLAYKGRKQEAATLWDQLGVSGAEREKDLLQDSAPLRENAIPEAAKLSVIARMRQSLVQIKPLWSKSARRPMLLGVFMMSMQQLSGIDGVMYYAPLLFKQAGISSAQASFLASGISAIVICVSTIAAFLLVDRWGRRTSTLSGGILLFGCMALIGSLYASNSVHADYGVGRWVVIVTIYIFAVTYCTTWALGVKIYASEIQPIATRATATSIAQAANCITNFIVALITPILLGASSWGIYFLFGGCAMLTVIVCALFMPETRGSSLEAIGEAFMLHNALDMPFLKSLRKLGSRIRRVVGRGGSQTSSSNDSVHSRDTSVEGIGEGGNEGSGGLSEEGIEMQILPAETMG